MTLNWNTSPGPNDLMGQPLSVEDQSEIHAGRRTAAASGNGVPHSGDSGVKADYTSHQPATGQVDVNPSLRRKVMSSLAWSLSGYAASQVVRFVFNLFLTRLLMPEVFGLMALVDLFLIGLHMFSDVGLGTSIVRSHRGDDPHYLNSAWSVQVVRGLCLWLGSCALAWPAAAFYETPQLAYALSIAGLASVMSGFKSVAVFTCERNLSQGRLILMQLVCYVLSTAIILLWLLLVGVSVWGVIVGRLVGCALELVGSHCFLCGPRCRFTWDWAVVLEILHFGKWIFVSTACTFLAEQADRLIVGKASSIATLGVYNLAFQLSLAAKHLILTITNRVVFPLYSRRFQQGTSLRVGFSSIYLWTAGFAAFLTAGLIGAGPAFIKCLFKPEYEAAGRMLQIVAIGGWIAMLQTVSGCLLWVVGNSRAYAASNVIKLLAVPVCAWGGHTLAGFEGMIAGFAVAELIRYGVMLLALRDQRLPILRYDLCLSVGIAVACLVAAQAGFLFTTKGERWMQFLVEGTAIAIFWLGLAVLRRRGLLPPSVASRP
jgi:O-antigen/teichoic acid export membrane protein